jgi:hypothetical protein
VQGLNQDQAMCTTYYMRTCTAVAVCCFFDLLAEMKMGNILHAIVSEILTNCLSQKQNKVPLLLFSVVEAK